MPLTTTTSAKAWAPDVYTFAAQDVVRDALYLTTTTFGGRVEGDAPSLRVAFIDDAAASFVDEFAEIPEADPTLNEVTVFTRKIALLTSVSNEQYRQQGADLRLSDSVLRSVVARADEALITQAAPVAPAVAPATGLVNQPGISTGTAAGITGMIDAAATVEDAGGMVDVWLASPKSWATMAKWSGITNGALVLGAGTQDAPRVLLGRPVIVNRAVPAGTIVGLDRRSVVAAYGDLTVATSEHAAFSRDGVQLRATWRVGHALVHPERVVSVTVTDPA